MLVGVVGLNFNRADFMRKNYLFKSLVAMVQGDMIIIMKRKGRLSTTLCSLDREKEF